MKTKRQSSSRPLLAFLLIVIGVGYLLKNLEIIPEFTIFLTDSGLCL